jgi:RNA polymerase sigma-70 factor (ECF subfamily)
VKVEEEGAAVLAAVRAGDESAFVALAERYQRQLHVYCYRMLGSLEEAEDMVQETLLRAWKARHKFEGRSLFRTWLYPADPLGEPRSGGPMNLASTVSLTG